MQFFKEKYDLLHASIFWPAWQTLIKSMFTWTPKVILFHMKKSLTSPESHVFSAKKNVGLWGREKWRHQTPWIPVSRTKWGLKRSMNDTCLKEQESDPSDVFHIHAVALTDYTPTVDCGIKLHSNQLLLYFPSSVASTLHSTLQLLLSCGSWSQKSKS